MQRILTLDTATENCSVALYQDGQVISRSMISPREHTQRILPMVDEVLAEAGIKLPELDAIAFGRGPGSFTGVRIGIGIAQGLAFGADLPMIGVSNLEAMAQAAHRLCQAEQALVAIDARMNEVYFGQFTLEKGCMRPVSPEQVIAPEQLLQQSLVIEPTARRAGTGWGAYPELIELGGQESDVLYPEALDMLPLALRDFDLAVPAEQASPVYLRDKVTRKKLPGRE